MANIELLLGEIKGKLEATDEANQRDHQSIIGFLTEIKTKNEELEKRTVSLETDRRIVTKISMVVSGLVSFIIAICSNLWTKSNV